MSSYPLSSLSVASLSVASHISSERTTSSGVYSLKTSPRAEASSNFAARVSWGATTPGVTGGEVPWSAGKSSTTSGCSSTSRAPNRFCDSPRSDFLGSDELEPGPNFRTSAFSTRSLLMLSIFFFRRISTANLFLTL